MELAPTTELLVEELLLLYPGVSDLSFEAVGRIDDEAVLSLRLEVILGGYCCSKSTCLASAAASEVVGEVDEADTTAEYMLP
jgi:hypothetical protein